ncbi:MAG TPA: iron-sulfur cluster assembly scaffold protein [Gammaproteobacteria bacterium]|nr:iron-sulfur cluster assembly scaffold protein [Gammaproteobacteria bacterium]
MEYTPEVVRRFDSPRTAGELRAGLPGLVSGEAEDRTLQVWVRFQLQVIDGVVRAARFAAFGCPHTIAAACRAAEWLEGRPASDVARLDVRAIGSELGLPAEKLGLLLRIEDAVAACGRALHKDVGKD